MESRYGHLILSDLKYEPPMALDLQEIYRKFAQRVMWIDGELVPGAFQMNISWYKSTPERDPIFPEHAHPAAELIGFSGRIPRIPITCTGRSAWRSTGSFTALTAPPSSSFRPICPMPCGSSGWIDPFSTSPLLPRRSITTRLIGKEISGTIFQKGVEGSAKVGYDGGRNRPPPEKGPS